MFSCFERAFTTVELLISMMIVGVMAAFLTPHLGRWLTTVGVDAAARELASELHLGKMRAISENTRYRISFDPASDTYVVQKDVAGDWQDGDRPKSLPNGIDLVECYYQSDLSNSRDDPGWHYYHVARMPRDANGKFACLLQDA